MLTRRRKTAIVIIVDSLLILVSNLFAFWFLSPFIVENKTNAVISFVIQLSLYLVAGFVFKIFRRVNRFTNFKEIVSIFWALFFSYLVQSLMYSVMGAKYSQRYLGLSYLAIFLLVISSRLVWRLLTEYNAQRKSGKCVKTRNLVVGAGAGGTMLVSALNNSTKNTEEVVGFVDDDLNKKGAVYLGKPVLGGLEELPLLTKELAIDTVTIAIPSLSGAEYQNIVELLSGQKVKITRMPSIEEIVSGEVSVTNLREVDVVDLLGRDEVQLDMAAISSELTDQVILVTGAGGSIGSEICRQVMRFNPKQLILLGHGENSIYLIEKELRTTFKNSQTEIMPVIADVQDRERIFEVMAMFKPTNVYHAAAHKHVPLMEHNPRESVKNNVYGTKNVAEAAKENQVTSFVMVSTDKANNPPNVMGSTKRIAEMIVTGLNEPGKTKFSAVRFGNVLGSRGSVVPLFKEQIANGGPVTITDMRMTRYFMTIPEASRLVIQAGALAQGGEVFILDMGEPVKIHDLAKQVIKLSGYTEDEIQIVETGIRPGEKLYEELLVDKEKSPEQIYDKIFVGNVTGYPLESVMDFVAHLPKDKLALSKELVAYANQSSKG